MVGGIKLYWKSDKLLSLILMFCLLDMTMIWLPLIRGFMDGVTYEWSLMGLLSGNGIYGDYWILILIALFGLTVQYMGWRGAKQPFRWLLLLWNIPALIFAIEMILDPQSITFKGDTLGISVPIGLPIALLYAGSFLLVIYWIIRDIFRKNKKLIINKWNHVNWYLFTAVLTLLPVQFILLRFGEPHGTTDQIGVVLTIIQLFLLVSSFYPWKNKMIEKDTACM